jgi:amidase
LNGLACIGPLARTVLDAALLLDATRGNQPGDLHRPRPPAEPYAATAERADPGELRIALSFKRPYAPVPRHLEPGARAAVERLAATLERLGHRVAPADPSYGVLGVGVLPRSIAGLHAWTRRVPDPALLDARTRETARIGRLLGGPILRAGRALERPMQAQVGAIFRRYDVVLTPTTGEPPLPIGELNGLSGWETDKRMLAACPFTWPWNVLGWPAMSVPAGLTDDGLPVGAQLLGPAGSESLLIALAAQLEVVERWYERRP